MNFLAIILFQLMKHCLGTSNNLGALILSIAQDMNIHWIQHHLFTFNNEHILKKSSSKASITQIQSHRICLRNHWLVLQWNIFIEFSDQLVAYYYKSENADCCLQFSLLCSLMISVSTARNITIVQVNWPLCLIL